MNYGTNVETLLNEIRRILRDQGTSGVLATEATLQAILAKDTLIEIDTDAINLSVDGLETLIGATNTALSTTNTNTGATSTVLGTTADAIVAAGAVGSISAKLRRVTQGLEDLKTLTVLAAGSNIIGNVRIDQTTLGTTNGISIIHHATANGAPTQFRSLTVNSTAVAVKGSAGNIYGWNIINLHSATIYIKLYNIAAASVNPASDVPTRTLMVPANGSIVEKSNSSWGYYSTAISVRAVTDSGDTGTTAPATLPIIELVYS